VEQYVNKLKQGRPPGEHRKYKEIAPVTCLPSHVLLPLPKCFDIGLGRGSAWKILRDGSVCHCKDSTPGFRHHGGRSGMEFDANRGSAVVVWSIPILKQINVYHAISWGVVETKQARTESIERSQSCGTSLKASRAIRNPVIQFRHAIPWMLVHLKRIRDFSVPK